MESSQAPIYLAGRRMTLAQVVHDPSLVPFELAEHEQNRSWSELWDEATRDVRERYERDGTAGWTRSARSTAATRSRPSCASAASPRARSSSTGS